MVSATIKQPPATFSSSGIRWPRVIAGGILLEFALIAVLVPIGAVFGAPPGLGSNVTQNAAVYLTAVPVACFVLGYCAGWIVARKVSARFLAHGLLVGIVATAFYLIMSSLNPRGGGVPRVMAAYGTIHFLATQILRIAGCTLGAVQHGYKRV